MACFIDMGGKKIRLNNLVEWKAESRLQAMLTYYNYSTARAFFAVGIELLLVGNSATNVIYGYDTTTEVTLEETIPPIRGVIRGAGNALVMANLLFGTYEASDEQAVLSAVKMVCETGTYMIKIEGDVRVAPRIRAPVNAGIPVMVHIGSTPQSVNALFGFKVQGRGAGAEQLHANAHAVADAGAAAVVLEVVSANLATEIIRGLSTPTCGIGTDSQYDSQVSVWQDAFAVPADGRRSLFSLVFEEVGEMLTKRAKQYVDQVHSREFPTEAQNFSG